MSEANWRNYTTPNEQSLLAILDQKKLEAQEEIAKIRNRCKQRRQRSK